jgi:hypothetical protein
MNRRVALFGACLALPLIAQAGTAGAALPDRGRYVYVPPGAEVVILPRAEAVAMPFAPVFAQQDSMMRRMIADMDQLMSMPMPDPQQMIRSVMSGMPQVAPRSSVVMTSVSTGNGTCSQTITYLYPGNGGAPVTKVSQSGDACGAIGSSAPIGVTETLPAPAPAAPQPVAPRHDRLWSVGYPPQPVSTGAPPQT